MALDYRDISKTWDKQKLIGIRGGKVFWLAIKIAIEKQIQKKPRFYAHNYYCSVCDNLVGNNEFEWQRFKYCDVCGQKLDWGDGE